MNQINIGDKFGHWTIIGGYKSVAYHKNYLCRCDCKDQTIRYVDIQNLKKGKSISCGCVTKETCRRNFTKHGQRNTRLFTAWNCMRARCNNPNNKSFKNYGGRGITICKEWDEFVNFREWAINNGYNEEATGKECSLDRIDVNGNYEPCNCRWVDAKTQSNNRRSNVVIEYKGEKHTATEWGEILGIKGVTIRERYKRGLSIEKVLYKGNLKEAKWTD